MIDLKIYIVISNIKFKKHQKWRNVIFVISQIEFTTESDLKILSLGYFVAKFVGKEYLNMKNIVMEGQESLSKLKISNWTKILKIIINYTSSMNY